MVMKNGLECCEFMRIELNANACCYDIVMDCNCCALWFVMNCCEEWFVAFGAIVCIDMI